MFVVALIDEISLSSSFVEFTENLTRLGDDVKFPTDEDLSGAAVALTRLQDAYNLDTTSLASGELNGIKYSTQLSGEFLQSVFVSFIFSSSVHPLPSVTNCKIKDENHLLYLFVFQPMIALNLADSLITTMISTIRFCGCKNL